LHAITMRFYSQEYPMSAFNYIRAIACLTLCAEAAFAGATSSAELYCKSQTFGKIEVTTQTKHAEYSTAYNGHKIRIHYVGTVHTGEPEYYQQVRSLLDQGDMLIEEGVAPSGFYGPPYLSPYYYDKKFDSQEERIHQTKLRIYTVGKYLAAYHAENGSYPTQLNDLKIVPGAGIYDAWGQPFVYSGDLNFYSLAPNGGPRLSLSDGIAPSQNTVFSENNKIYEDSGYNKEFKALFPRAGRQPNFKDSSRTDRKTFYADVSIDLMSTDDIPKLNSYLRMRDKIPSILIEQMIKMTSKDLTISLHYGCAHGVNMDKKIKQVMLDLTGVQPEVKYEWLNVYNLSGK